MKPISLLLAASLVANVALVTVYVTRSPSTVSAPAAGSRSPATSATAADTDAALRAALASGDAAALRAAGLSPELARDLALARAFTKIAAHAHAARAQNAADTRWWRSRGGAPGAREQQLVARRELADALMTAFGDDLGLGGGEAVQFAFLSPEKRDALRRITQDYDEMMAKFSAGGLQLPSDKEKLRLLRAERDRDIAALLTPEERLAYEMRTSTSGNTVRNRYGDTIESEAEFQKIFALQKAFDEKFPRDALTGRISPEVMRARSDGERQLDADLRAAVGDERYSTLRRAADPDLRTVDSLVSRLNLPPTTTDQVAATREAFAAESQRISSDTSIPFQQRRAQIQDLATRAKADLSRALGGGEATEAYAQSSQWVNLLQNGMAYSTTAQPGSPASLGIGAQSVFPVMPAGATSPGGARQQVFISSTPPPDGAGGGSDRVITNSNVQMVTFGTSDSTTTGNAPAGARQTIVAPTQPAQPATPTPPR